MINRVIKIGLSATLLITSLYSASFDCKKASTFIENTICNDAELSKLDEELAAAYKKVFKSLSDKTDLKKEQLDWLKSSRDKCMSLECLKTSYTNRVLYLTNYDSRDSQTNTVAISSNDIAGLYKKGSAFLEVNQDLSFNYNSVNERNGNMCLIEGEKFKLENGNFVWNSKESSCKITLSNGNKNSVNLNVTGNECNYYCGNNAYIIDGIYTKEKNIVNQNQSARQTANTAKPAERLPQVEIYNISPNGKLADMYNFGSKHTDIQRDNMEKEIKGKTIRWQLPVYEVSKITDNKYRISTGSGELFEESYVSTSIEISARNSKEVEYIESLMTGNMIKIQGKITGVTLRSIYIEEASFY